MDKTIYNAVVDKVLIALKQHSGYKNIKLSQDNDSGMKEISLSIKQNAMVSIKSYAAMLIMRCDIVAEGYSDSEIQEITAKTIEQFESNGLEVNRTIDENRVAIMSILQSEEHNEDVEKNLFGKVLGFCQTVTDFCSSFISNHNGDENEHPVEDAEGSEVGRYDILFDRISQNIEEGAADSVDASPTDSVETKDLPLEADPGVLYEEPSNPVAIEDGSDIDLSALLDMIDAQESQSPFITDGCFPEKAGRPTRRKKNRRKNKRERQNVTQQVENTENDMSPSESASCPPSVERVDVSQQPELQSLRDRLYAEVEQYHDQITQRLNRREQELHNYQVSLDAQTAALVEQQTLFTAEMQKKQQEADAYQTSAMAELQRQKQQDLADLEAIKESNMEQLSQLSDRLDGVRRDLDFRETQLAAKEDDLKAQQRELAQDRQLFDQLKAANLSAPEFVHIRVQTLEAENAKLQQQLDEIKQLNEHTEETKARIAELENQINNMVLPEDANLDPSVLRDLREQVRRMEEQNRVLSNQLNLYRKATAALRTELERKNTEQTKSNNELTEQLNRALSECDFLRDKSNRQEVDMQSLSQQLDEARQTAEELQNEVDECRARECSDKPLNANSSDETPRFTSVEVQNALTSLGIQSDVKPANGQVFIVGQHNGCSININFSSDFAYFEKVCKNTRRCFGRVADLNRNSGITTNYWVDNNKIACRLDYTMRPNCSIVREQTLAELISGVCEVYDEFK